MDTWLGAARRTFKSLPTLLVAHYADRATRFLVAPHVTSTGEEVLTFLILVGVWTSWPRCGKWFTCSTCEGQHRCKVCRFHFWKCEGWCDNPPRRTRRTQDELPADIKAALDPLPQGA